MLSRAFITSRKFSKAPLQQVANFHACSPRRDETSLPSTKEDFEILAAKERPGILNKMGLDDWKVSLPVGAAIAFPAVANEWYVLSEETQLIFCFALFSGAAYRFASQMLADSLDADQAALVEEFNKLEDIKCQKLKAQIAFWTPQLDAVSYIDPLKAKHHESFMKGAVVDTQKKKYELSDAATKTLSNFMLLKSQSDEAKVNDFLDNTANKTLEDFKTNSKMKAAAINQVFAILEAPKEDHDDVAYLAMVESSKQFEKDMTSEDPALKSKLDAVLKEGTASFSSIL